MDTSEKGLLSRFTKSGLLDRKKLEFDLQKVTAFYHNHGYIRAKIGEPKISYEEGKGLTITIEVIEGEQPAPKDLWMPGLIGFLIGFKVVWIMLNWDLFTANAQQYLLTTDGSFIGGLLIGGLSVAYRYYKLKQKALPEPLVKKTVQYPHDLIGDMILIAAIAGVLGSNFFNFFSSKDDGLEEFFKDPVGSLFSGLTIYGGLIFGAIGLIWYARKKRINVPHLFDALGLAFMIAYGIGRIGCHVSGDGDWGIINNNPKPAWVPQFLWSSHYEHNVLGDSPMPVTVNGNEMQMIEGCEGKYCQMLVEPVYPTPLYELGMCIILFAILWSLRKKLTVFPGMLMGVFLIFNGVERFLIEKIRVNDPLSFLGLNWTQAEYIAVGMVVVGIGIVLYTRKRGKEEPPFKPSEKKTQQVAGQGS
jgi:prolipoprotein diacylglyceryltransferase